MNRNFERTGAMRRPEPGREGWRLWRWSARSAQPRRAAARSDAPAPAASITVARGEVRSLQLGVGRSMIVDLPEDAQEIFVGDPKIANAIVRSARRIYISTLASGADDDLRARPRRAQDRGARSQRRPRRRRVDADC